MKKTYYTYSKSGRVTKHSKLSTAKNKARIMSLLGSSIVDSFDGKATRTVARYKLGKLVSKF